VASNLLTFAEKVHEASAEQVVSLRFDKRFQVDGLLACSYLTLIEHLGGMICLTRAQKRTSSDAVFRSLLEGFVDFKNIFQDRRYFFHMLAKYTEERIALLELAAKGGNPYLEDLKNWEGVPKAREQYQTEFEHLTAEGFAPLKIWQRFDRAEMRNEYKSVYCHVSGGAHNDIGALRSRHITIEGNDFGIHLYKMVDLKHFQTQLDGAVSFVLMAGAMIHDHLNSSAKPQFDALIKELEEVRVTYAD
jgi:hypothetical protein